MKKEMNEFKRGGSVLLGCFSGMFISIISLYYYSGGVWVQPWQDDFGWSRAEIGFGNGIGTFALVIGTPFAGMLIDRVGIKKMASLSLLLYGFCLFLFTKMNGTLWNFYLLALIMSLVALPSTAIGFTRVVNAWFEKNKGLALGICLTATGLGAAFTNGFLTPYVAENGWQNGYFLLFCIVIAGTPIVWLLINEHPPKTEEAKEIEVLTGMTLKEAISTKAFKALLVLFVLTSIAILGLIPNFIPLLQDAGMNPTKAGRFAAIMGLSVVTGRLIAGFLIDRIFAPKVILILFIFVSSGCLALGLGGIDYALWGAIALGLAVGSEVDLIGFFTAKYFGMKHYSAISGVLFSAFMIGGIISPTAVGYVWDTIGNYDMALIAASVMMLVAAGTTLLLPKFKEEVKELA